MKKPNIIVILADDIGLGDFNCYNNNDKIPTPNIDKLAEEGMWFTDAHSSSAVCTPSRYGIMTGRYCFRSQLKRSVLVGYEPPLIEQGRETLASMLRRQGYATACIGKWHLGMGFHSKAGQTLDFGRPLPWGVSNRGFEEKIDFERPMFGGPTDLGFDSFFGTVGCSTCQPPYAFVRDNRFVATEFQYCDEQTPQLRPGMRAVGWENKDADPAFLEETVSFIEKAAKAASPMFVYLCPSASHEPCTEQDTPAIAVGKSKAGFRGDMVWLFDYMVGAVVQTLKRKGVWEDTILVVTSDNGALPGDRIHTGVAGDGFSFETYGHNSNGTYRGYKSHIWEGGHREPLLISWPNRIAPGTVCNGLVCLTDLFETFREIADGSVQPTGGEDSVSMLPMLMDCSAKSSRDHAVHHSQTGVFSLREGDWKLIFECQSSGGWPPPTDRISPVQGLDGQLYNIKDDPGETNNLYSAHPEMVYRMSERLMALKNNERSFPRQ